MGVWRIILVVSGWWYWCIVSILCWGCGWWHFGLRKKAERKCKKHQAVGEREEAQYKKRRESTSLKGND